MSVNIVLAAQELAELRLLTKRDCDADAVVQAAREFVRMSRLRELMAVSGKVEFDDNWRELEDLELNETDFPQ